jgi:predicted metal-binding membrane protein
MRGDATVFLIVSAVGLACWLYLFTGAGTGMSVIAMTTAQFPPPAPRLIAPGNWSLAYAAAMLGMWSTMMAAMMLPGALYLRSQSPDQPRAMSSALAAWIAYLLPWLMFSVIATLLQFMLEQWRLVDGMKMWSTNLGLSAALLAVAASYQFSPWKRQALASCRADDGQDGWSSGWRHGTACIIRCTPLMLLLFVGGSMNLVWIAGLTMIVFAETLPRVGETIRISVGVALGIMACICAIGAW